MARRMVLGRRGTAFGLWISKPGSDALSAAEAQLLFSMTSRAGMVLSSGTVVVPNGGVAARVSFGTTYPSVPLVFCGPLTDYPANRSVSSEADSSGFNVRAIRDDYSGTYPAAGMSARWFAVMKTEN